MRFLLIVLSLIISVGIGFIVMQLPKFLGMQSNYTMEILFGTTGLLVASLLYEYIKKKIDVSYKE